MIVDIVHMDTMENKLFDQIANEVEHVVYVSALLGNID